MCHPVTSWASTITNFHCWLKEIRGNSDIGFTVTSWASAKSIYIHSKSIDNRLKGRRDEWASAPCTVRRLSYSPRRLRKVQGSTWRHAGWVSIGAAYATEGLPYFCGGPITSFFGRAESASAPPKTLNGHNIVTNCEFHESEATLDD